MNNQFEKTQPDIRANGDPNRPGENPNDPSTWPQPNKESKHHDEKRANPGGVGPKDRGDRDQKVSGR